MTHPLKQQFDRLSNQQLNDLESVLFAVLQETEQHAAWLLTEEGRQLEDWADEDAATTARMMVLCKILGVGPTKN